MRRDESRLIFEGVTVLPTARIRFTSQLPYGPADDPFSCRCREAFARLPLSLIEQRRDGDQNRPEELATA